VRIGLIIMGMMILYEHIKPGTTRNWIRKEMNRTRATILGFIAAFVDVAVGGGWGPLGTPALILAGEEPRNAVGVIEFTEPVISLAAVLTFGMILGFESFMWIGSWLVLLNVWGLLQ
jgi:uncharacterized membrane protein YfcA